MESNADLLKSGPKKYFCQPHTMPVDNRRIAGPEITQPVVLGGEKRHGKPLVTAEMFILVLKRLGVVNSKIFVPD